MLDQDLGFLVNEKEPRWPLLAARPDGLGRLLESWTDSQARFLRETGFKAAAQELAFVPGPEGLAGAVLGLGEDRSPYAFGNLAFRLPEERAWRLQPGDYDPQQAVLGWYLGAYHYAAFKP